MFSLNWEILQKKSITVTKIWHRSFTRKWKVLTYKTTNFRGMRLNNRREILFLEAVRSSFLKNYKKRYYVSDWWDYSDTRIIRMWLCKLTKMSSQKSNSARWLIFGYFRQVSFFCRPRKLRFVKKCKQLCFIMINGKVYVNYGKSIANRQR